MLKCVLGTTLGFVAVMGFISQTRRPGNLHACARSWWRIKVFGSTGGAGEIGYAEQKMDLITNDLGDIKLQEAAKSAREGFAKLCKFLLTM